MGNPPPTFSSRSSPLKKKGKGTGLGLATVYGIVKQSHGFIFADSLPDGGTTFDLYFPLIDAPLPATNTAPSSKPQSGSETIPSKTSKPSDCC